MTWEEKMDFIIGEVLGEGYNTKVINDNSFYVYYVDTLLHKIETIYSLPNHWRKAIKETIELIINRSIVNAFLKLDK